MWWNIRKSTNSQTSLVFYSIYRYIDEKLLLTNLIEYVCCIGWAEEVVWSEGLGVG